MSRARASGRMQGSLLFVALAVSPAALAAEKGVRFWNLTSATITELRLAPQASENFGADQCKNDKDGSVDHDERLPITNVAPGVYDMKIGYKGGKVCRVPNVTIESGRVFSIEDKDMVNCSMANR